ncbi:MAG: hypothetical protein GY953_16670, partial [bacterium]|nr:hypothetical protein [bacterium]
MTLTRDSSSRNTAVLEGGEEHPAPVAEETRYESKAWDLTELLPDTSEASISRELDRVEAEVEDFVRRRETLDPEMEPGEFLAMMREYERLIDNMDMLGAHASLCFSSGTQSAAALGHRNRMQQVLTQMHNRILFFDLWW